MPLGPQDVLKSYEKRDELGGRQDIERFTAPINVITTRSEEVGAEWLELGAEDVGRGQRYGIAGSSELIEDEA